jgi:DNA-directed RNA polymerase specialized sigma24 family protein
MLLSEYIVKNYERLSEKYADYEDELHNVYIIALTRKSVVKSAPGSYLSQCIYTNNINLFNKVKRIVLNDIADTLEAPEPDNQVLLDTQLYSNVMKLNGKQRVAVLNRLNQVKTKGNYNTEKENFRQGLIKLRVMYTVQP